MHILKIIHGYPPLYNAGSEVYSQSICNELARSHRVSIFTREENIYISDHIIRHEYCNGIDFYIVNKAREKDGYAHPDLDTQFAQLLARIKPDVCHIGHLNHLSTGLVAAAKQQGIPVVFTLHDFWLMCPRGQFLQINFAQPTFHQLCSGQDDRKCASQCYNRFFSGEPEAYERDLAYWESWIHTRMETTRQLAHLVDVFIAPSRYLRDRFIADFGISPDKIVYLDYGFPLEYLRPVQPKPHNRFTFGYIGTHIPAKGVNLLIEAFSRLQSPAELLIFGRENGQSTRMLRQMASKSPNPIQFRGEYVNQNLASEVFAHVDAIVVPSIWAENSPLVIHEAQACQIPVITANHGGMAEYVQHHVNGLLFEHRNADSLTAQLQFALENPSFMAQIGQRGYLYAPNGTVPGIEDHCLSLSKIYQQLISHAAHT